MAINLTTTLKGLTTKLLQYANVTILPTTGVTNNLANSIVSLDNPFSSDLTITNIQGKNFSRLGQKFPLTSSIS